MKRMIKSVASIVLAFALIFTIASCGANVWESATYVNDTALGEGEKTVIVEVKAEEQMVSFTVKTDKDTVGAALLEHDLIAGEDGQYGLYVKSVNGIVADYDIDQTYWAFYIDGEYAMTGVDSTEIAEGVTYQFERVKG